MHNSRRDGGHYGQYNAYQAHQAYGQQQQQQRRSSFDYGDDSAVPTGNQNQQQSYQAYGQNQNIGSPNPGAQGYGGQYAAASPPPLHTEAYNPANYASPSQLPTSPGISSPRIAMPAGNYAAAHVPYNPAAYGATSPPAHQGAFYQPYQSPPTPAYTQHQTPPLPPKPPELIQNSSPYPRAPVDRRGAVSTTTPAESYMAYGSLSPSSPYSSYTPPAPPPPPTHNYNSSASYQPYTSPNLNAAQPPPPPEHRRLNSVTQDGVAAQDRSQASQYQTWAPRMAGASLRSDGSMSQQPMQTTSSATSTQSRPLPPPPEDFDSPDYSDTEVGHIDNDPIMAEIEQMVSRPTINRRPVPSRGPTSQPAANDRASHMHSDSLGITSPGMQTSTNSVMYNGHHDDSDAEAAAGLHEMRIAEQEEMSRPNRHQSSASAASAGTAEASYFPDHNAAGAGEESDGFDVPMDLSMGFDPGMNYGYGPGIGSPVRSPPAEPFAGTTVPGGDNGAVSFPVGDYSAAKTFSNTPYGLGSDDELLSPRMTARVDTGGTGGLAEPTARRMSFDDGDEATLVNYDDERSSVSISPTKGDNEHLRRTGSGRPLPPTPENGQYLQAPQRHLSHQDRFDPNSYEARMAAQTDVRKTNSLNGPAHAGLTVPERSITDGEKRRKSSNRASYLDVQAKADAAFPGPGEIDLPLLPPGRRRKFVPSKLSSKDYSLCEEPWAISSVLAWVRTITEGETDLKEQPIVDALVGLFTHKVPTMNIADAELLGANLVVSMIHEAALQRDEEWVKFTSIKMSGVIYQLTGTGCYSSKVHTTTMHGRCYSRFCMRTLKKIDLQAQKLAPERNKEDWHIYYGLDAEWVKKQDKEEVARQYILHEMVQGEDNYVDQLDILLVLYRDGLAKNDKPILALTAKQPKFLADVFGKVAAVKKVNEEYLLSRFKYRQQEQGPWIVGYSDIFREWIRRARTAYVEYATGLPNAISQMKSQKDQNILFKQFLDQVQQHPRSKRLDWSTYLKAPIARLQRYGLLLETLLKKMKPESQERTNTVSALEEIKQVTMECDTKVAEMTRKTDMAELTAKLKLRPGMSTDLQLTQTGRQIVHRGDLTRRGNSNINWVETHAILFDHYLVLAKPTRTKDHTGTVKSEYYDVSKLPISMDLLVLESANDGTVMKHSVKGIVPLGAAPVAKPATPGGQDLRLSRTATGTQSNGASPANAGQAAAIGPPDSADSENLLYPFRVQHLGKLESYVLYASSPQVRQEWADKITFAKTQHAASLFAQNAEPFKLRVLADTSFAYSNTDVVGSPPVHIAGTPLDRAVKSVEAIPLPRPAPICRSQVNCATAFTPAFTNRNLLAVGTDFGVFITEQGSPRTWYKAINAQHVTQISVLEDFSVLLIIADKALIAFHLDAVCPPTGGPPSNANDSKRTPQKLSGSRDVGFFAVGRIKERMLVFYKKRDGISSTFKVLEPVYQKSSTASSTGSGWSRSRFGLKQGKTELFRDYDDFYIASDTYAINLFSSSLGIASQRGIEVLTLDKKVAISIPEPRTVEAQQVAARIKDQRPLGMFRLTDSEFILAFEEVAIYVDKHGEISRAVVMSYVGKARQATLYNSTYLVLVDAAGGFIEVRNATDGRLRQVIAGRDVKLLDDGMASGASTAGIQVQAGVSRGTIKISMMHPELERGCIVLEMLVNEELRERGVQ